MSAIVRLAFRLSRFEALALILGSLGLTVATLIVALRLTNVGVPISCFGQPDVHGVIGSTDPACRTVFATFAEIYDRESERILAILVAFPVVAGMLLGVSGVSRELEQGTAVLPWTLSGRRRRWLIRRCLALGGLVVLALVPLALAADVLEAARNPLVAPDRSFAAEGLRGGVLIARGVAGFGVGILIGAVVGRQLPSVIVGLVASLVLVTGALVVMDSWSQAVATFVPVDSARLGDRSIRAAYLGRDGEIVSVAAIAHRQPVNPSLPPGTIDDRWIAANFDEVLLIVPGSRYGEEVALHSALLAGVGLLAVIAAIPVIDRRGVM